MSEAPEFAASLLRTSGRAYAQATFATLQASAPKLVAEALPEGFALPVEDIEVRLQQLAASLEVDRSALFADALAWYKVAFHHRDVPAGYLDATLRAIEKTLERELPRESFACVRQHIATASAGLDGVDVEPPSQLSREAPFGETAMRFLLANLEGRGDAALDLVRGLIRDGVSVADVQDHVLAPAQREAGRMWLTAEIPVADEHYGSSVVEQALWLLQEHVPRPAEDAACVLTMGVPGNLHDLGLRMVAQRLQIAGYRLHHLGANMPTLDLEWALRNRDVDAIAMSASMLLHLNGLRSTVASVREAIAKAGGRPDGVPIVVGGRPFELVKDLHEVLGADAGVATAADAPVAIGALLAR